MSGGEGSISIPKVWRSEVGGLAIYLVLSGLAIVLSERFPGSIIRGNVIAFELTALELRLPVFWLLPLTACFVLIFRMYNVRYVADSRGIESVSGVLSLKQRITRVRYEDIRSIETDQTVLERMLDIGTVEVGTAATSGIELVLVGVSAPKEIRDMFQAERDKRDRIAQRQDTMSSPATG